MVTKDPYRPWKHAEATVREAKVRGFEVLVALDERTSVEDAERIGRLADAVRPFSGECCEDAFGLVSEISGWVFRVDDDEQPSDLAWKLATHPPMEGVFGIPVIPVLDRKMWRRDMGLQERLFPARDWRWEGGFNGHAVHPYKSYAIGVNPGVIIWHHVLEAPLDERVAKAERYDRLGPGDHHGRLLYENAREELVDIPPYMLRYLPRAHERLN